MKKKAKARYTNEEIDKRIYLQTLRIKFLENEVKRNRTGLNNLSRLVIKITGEKK